MSPEMEAALAETRRHVANIERNTARVPWIAALWVLVFLLWLVLR